MLTLIGAPPTLKVLNGPGVHVLRSGAVSIVNPTLIHVTGTAQPGNASTRVLVGIFAEDRDGNVINGGQPLAVTAPDFLGHYRATVALPSTIRKDVNFLVAREEAVGTQVSQITINGTTISGLAGAIQINPGSISGLSGSIATPTLGISGIGGSISNPGGTVVGLSGSINNPATNISGLSGSLNNPATNISGFGGSISNPATTISGLGGSISLLGGSISAFGGSLSIDNFPITTPAGAGSGGPATGSFTGGSGTIGTQSGTFSDGTGTIGASTSTQARPALNIRSSTSLRLSGGYAGTIERVDQHVLRGQRDDRAPRPARSREASGTLAAGTSSFAQAGSATLNALTGTLSGGTGTIAPTTGTSTQILDEVAVSDPVTVFIHQGRVPLVVRPLQSAAANRAAVAAALAAERGG